jgi:nitrate reductase delta subunit
MQLPILGETATPTAPPPPQQSPAELFARLVSYPDAQTAELAGRAADDAQAANHPCQDALEAFAVQARLLSAAELQEAYTRAFDMSPGTTLEVGWHLFGDTYKRGQFLAYLRGELRQRGVEAGSELPDHLGVLLRLMPRLSNEDSIGLAEDCLLPALDRLIVPLEGNLYAELLNGLRTWLDPNRGPAQPPRQSIELPVLQDAMEGTHG